MAGEGMALLTASGKILKGRSLAEGASEALPAFAQQIGEARRAEAQEKRAIEQMNFALADAERKERMGDARGAQAALEAARKFQQDANRAQGDKLRYIIVHGKKKAPLLHTEPGCSDPPTRSRCPPLAFPPRPGCGRRAMAICPEWVVPHHCFCWSCLKGL